MTTNIAEIFQLTWVAIGLVLLILSLLILIFNDDG